MTLFIHIGYGKTGSSAIQSFLARNHEVLARHGLIYPHDPSFRSAARGKTSSGNGRFLWDKGHAPPREGDVLYSSEQLFDTMLRDDRMRALVGRADQPVKVLLFVRDPFDHMFSAWGQSVKRAGGTMDPNDFALAYQPAVQRAVRWIDAAESNGFEIDVRNYSRHENEIIETFLDMIFGARAPRVLADCEPIAHRVNRSLTLAEYEIQLLFNKHYPRPSFSFVSDPLIEQLPDIPAQTPMLRPEVHDEVRDRLSEAMRLLNTRLPEAERIRIPARDELPGGVGPARPGDFVLSHDQLEVLVRSLSKRLIATESLRARTVFALSQRFARHSGLLRRSRPGRQLLEYLRRFR